MAQKVVVTRLCDREHPVETEADGDGPVYFAFEGQEYEIDLCKPHTSELTLKLGDLAQHARRVKGRQAAAPRPARPARDRGFPRQVRNWYSGKTPAWRERHGLPITIAERGRVPGVVIAAYRAALNASG